MIQTFSFDPAPAGMAATTCVAGNGGVRSSGPEVKRPFYTQLRAPARFERRRGHARQHLNSYFWMKFCSGQQHSEQAACASCHPERSDGSRSAQNRHLRFPETRFFPSTLLRTSAAGLAQNDISTDGRFSNMLLTITNCQDLVHSSSILSARDARKCCESSNMLPVPGILCNEKLPDLQGPGVFCNEAGE